MSLQFYLYAFLSYFYTFLQENGIYCLLMALSSVTYLYMVNKKIYFLNKKSRDFLTMGSHQEKNSVPSMGGIGFFWLLPALYIFLKRAGIIIEGFYFISLSVVLSSFVGALDDIFKIRYGKGLAIKPKFFLQMFVSFIPAMYYWYIFPQMCFIKFPWGSLMMGPWYILWIVWVLMSTTHAVNLIDGIDGLAITQVGVVLLISPLTCIGSTWFLLMSSLYPFWLSFNQFKARLFMGDIGSFFLGGFLASVFIFFKAEVLLILSGFVFVLNTVICLMQIWSFKFRKKRIFSFTPYHHALEKKGWSENKIVGVYSLITFIFSIFSFFLYVNYYLI
jgi:phospho-N-acetylmuramoyl-pentapeptide-transferase